MGDPRLAVLFAESVCFLLFFIPPFRSGLVDLVDNVIKPIVKYPQYHKNIFD
jgi:hypothetical protein